MKYQNDPTKPDYNPSPQEQFRFDYNLKGSCALTISIVISNAVRLLLNSSTGKFGTWFNIAVSGVLLIYATVNLAKFFYLAKKPEKLEELYRRHTDERNAMIREKVAGGSFTAVTYIICIAMMIFAYIDMLTAFVLAGLLLAMLIIRVLLKIYYERKY
ncbi:MAG: hypothetical protein NC253_03980 [Ruminococcus sp.]|nr:hypothetical protein [Ruminococcus sp.]MCM1381149.1 hypothetical protein [Muribaculaceae bacterium]MCM1478818.1 hypothetical protein [Muribaculaceae bacterium]